MKFKLSLALFLSVVFMLTGCSNNASVTESDSDVIESTEAAPELTIDTNENPDKDLLYSSNFPTYEELQADYPDKIVLVWTIEETGYERNYPFRSAEINEYLDSLGCDYCVCFYPIRAMQNEDKSDYYTSYVADMIENGEQVDIVYSSFTSVQESGNNAFHKYIYNGIFEPLNEYFETDIGKKLYDVMPEEHWQALTVDGNIYGVDGAMHTLSDDYGYYINSELASKYGFDTSLPIEDQVDILDEIAENENCDIIVSYNDFSTTSYLVDIKEITSAVYFDEDEQTAKCILDNSDYMEKLRFFYDMNQKEYVVDPELAKSSTFFMLKTNFSGGKEHSKNSETATITYNGNSITAIPVFMEDTSVRSSYMATGISSSSEHKDMAFELLALTQTDSYLNNLLTYGKEGEDYQLTDGKVDTIINPVSLDRFANKMICYPTASGTLKSDEYISVYQNAKVSDTLGFAFDGRDVIPQTSATSLIFMSFDIFSVDDFDNAIADLRTELEQNGLNEVIDACNQQYQEYIS